MGVKGEDLWMSTKAEELYPYSVECKNVEKLNVWSAIKQAREEARVNGKIPLVAFTRNHEETYVVIPIEELLELRRSYNGNNDADQLANAPTIED